MLLLLLMSANGVSCCKFILLVTTNPNCLKKVFLESKYSSLEWPCFLSNLTFEKY